MESLQKLRYAVVGLKHGAEHVHAALRHPRAELKVCCDLDEQIFRSLNPGCAFTTDYQEVLDRDDVDAVVIALPTGLHAEYSIRAMEAGKHVLCEKPLALNMTECQNICDCVKRTGKVFQLGYEVRFSSLQKQILKQIRNGAVGEVTNVWWNMFVDSPHTGWRASREKRGGKIFDCACHYYDLLEQWAGAPVKKVCVFGNKKGATGVMPDGLPDSAVILFEYENGVRGTYNLCEISNNLQNSMGGIAGTEGKINVEPYYPNEAGSLEIQSEGGEVWNRITFHDTGRSDFSGGHLGFNEQHTAFIAAVLDHEPVRCTAEEGMHISHLLDAIDQSLASGNAVEL